MSPWFLVACYLCIGAVYAAWRFEVTKVSDEIDRVPALPEQKALAKTVVALFVCVAWLPFALRRLVIWFAAKL